MVTRTQVNKVAGDILIMVVKNYPSTHVFIARAVIKLAKDEGTVLARDIARAILRELYQEHFGVDPVGRHEFKHWLYGALRPTLGQLDPILGNVEPLTGVDTSDAFEAFPEDITP